MRLGLCGAGPTVELLIASSFLRDLQHTLRMASASSSQSTFRLGRSKKSPTVMDQIGKFFGGEKKKKGKVRIEQASQRLYYCFAGLSRLITRSSPVNQLRVIFSLFIDFYLLFQSLLCTNLLSYSISSID